MRVSGLGFTDHQTETKSIPGSLRSELEPLWAGSLRPELGSFRGRARTREGERARERERERERGRKRERESGTERERERDFEGISAFLLFEFRA